MAALLKLGSISLDCADSHELASFYSRLLDKMIAYDVNGFSAIRLDGVWLSFRSVEGYRAPTWPDSLIPQQIHLDFAVADLGLGELAALKAGAVKMELQPSPERWLVFKDPAGHPFCLSSLIPE